MAKQYINYTRREERKRAKFPNNFETSMRYEVVSMFARNLIAIRGKYIILFLNVQLTVQKNGSSTYIDMIVHIK
jgi:hypothetical protein